MNPTLLGKYYAKGGGGCQLHGDSLGKDNMIPCSGMETVSVDNIANATPILWCCFLLVCCFCVCLSPCPMRCYITMTTTATTKSPKQVWVLYFISLGVAARKTYDELPPLMGWGPGYIKIT